MNIKVSLLPLLSSLKRRPLSPTAVELCVAEAFAHHHPLDIFQKVFELEGELATAIAKGWRTILWHPYFRQHLAEIYGMDARTLFLEAGETLSALMLYKDIPSQDYGLCFVKEIYEAHVCRLRICRGLGSTICPKYVWQSKINSIDTGSCT